MSLTILYLCIIYLLAVSARSLEDKVYYTGYSVLRAIPSNETKLQAIEDLLENDYLDFWMRPSGLNVPSDIMVSPTGRKELEDYFKQHRIEYHVMIDDLQQLIEEDGNETFPEEDGSVPYGSDSFFQDYKKVNEMYSYMDFLEAQHHTLAKVQHIGKSFEQQDMKLIKIGKRSSLSKPAVWIDAGFHAREWIAPPTALYIATRLLGEYETDKEVRRLVDSLDWYIMPLVNPDGYRYSRETNRFWRKNRSRNAVFPVCVGVDLNRNFGFKWNVIGASSKPCSEIFAGPSAFSETETESISEFLKTLKGRLKLYLTFHSYGQYMMTPWGYTKDLPPNYREMESLARTAAASLRKKHGTDYQIGSSANLLYAAAGGSDDWALGALGVNYSYTFELRDNGRYGFLLPRRYISPVGEETWEGIKTMASTLLSRMSLKNK